MPTAGSIAVAADRTVTVVFDGAPIEKVKAPATGWLSAETACQATV